VTSCIRMLRLGVIVQAETMMLVTSATGSGRMALAVDRHGIVSREDKSVGPQHPDMQGGKRWRAALRNVLL
jgi:hypothetical protein